MQSFARLWEQCKAEHDMISFNDMLKLAYHELEEHPQKPQVILMDEAQDCSLLSAQLVKKWGEKAEWFFSVGDPLQLLFSWCGSEIEAFTQPALPAKQQEVLSRSWRVPRAVHQFALRWIEPHLREIEAQLGMEIKYEPRFEITGYKENGKPIYGTEIEEGELRALPSATWKYPEPAIKDAERYLNAGKDVMFITSCSYMLNPLIAALRKAGLPFHNPLRPTRGDWNPLSGRGTTGAMRLLNFLRMDERIWGDDIRLWNAKELHSWVDLLEAKGLLRHGAKEAIKAEAAKPGQEGEDGLPLSGELSLAQLTTWFNLSPDELVNLIQAIAEGEALEWLGRHLLSTKRRSLEFPIAIAQRYGPAKLRERPMVTVGTIHCSPGDEPVLTTTGYVPIGELDPEKHRLASYNYGCNRLTWGKRISGEWRSRKGDGFEFRVARNPYSGPILTISTERSRTRVTPDHKMRVKFTDSFYEKWVVYLMRKNDWWRIGICKSANRPYKCGDLHTRMSTEQADAGWILGIYDTRKEALMEEARTQTHYGIPSLTFHADKSRALTTAELHSIHESVKGEVAPRAEKLLQDRGWRADCPLYVRNGKRGEREGGHSRFHAQTVYAFETIAANLIPGYMEVPVADEEFHVTQWKESLSYANPDWLPVSVSDEHFEGDVYSLEVKPYEFYISGGAVVHNSLKGAEAACVFAFPDLSIAGMDNWQRIGPDREAVRRAMYVQFTRASETLVLCQRATPHAITYPSMK